LQHERRTYLWDAHRAGEAVLRYVRGRTLDDYRSDDYFRSAVERQLQNVGEAIAQLARLDAETAARIPDMRRIVAFRNVLVHGYALLDHDVVWNVIHEHLPGLVSALDALLAELGPPDA
jgi:uncharacterized protein with HEPN domain